MAQDGSGLTVQPFVLVCYKPCAKSSVSKLVALHKSSSMKDSRSLRATTALKAAGDDAITRNVRPGNRQVIKCSSKALPSGVDRNFDRSASVALVSQ